MSAYKAPAYLVPRRALEKSYARRILPATWIASFSTSRIPHPVLIVRYFSTREGRRSYDHIPYTVYSVHIFRFASGVDSKWCSREDGHFPCCGTPAGDRLDCDVLSRYFQKTEQDWGRRIRERNGYDAGRTVSIYLKRNWTRKIS